MVERKRSRIPRFQRYEEEAAFWDTQDLSEFEDELAVVENVRIARPLEHHLSVQLDAQGITELAAIARQQGVGPSTLARIWLMERLAEEREARSQRARATQQASSPAAP